MNKYICCTCGIQYSLSKNAPDSCVICTEERQYVPVDGQKWTTLEDMKENSLYKNTILPEEPGIVSVVTKPTFGIGQTAYLVQDHKQNILWDCITYLDDKTIEEINKMGGIQGIALSHPHYYSTQIEWAEAFDCNVYIHESDRQWVQRPDRRIVFWEGETLSLSENITR